MQLGASELILNADKSIYHLNLLPEDVAETVITVGDPNRVSEVSRFFESIELKKAKREFITHTGQYNNKRITVISTGIGTDNVDIVLNELDALVNIDFDTRTVKDKKRSLEVVRIGTSGAIQPEIPVDSIVISEYAIGFDNLLHFYDSEHIQHPNMQLAFIDHTQWSVFKSIPYVVQSDIALFEKLNSNRVQSGLTASNVGFYGPQGRVLRLPLEDESLNAKIASFEYEGRKITNLEMETSGLYGLCQLLGHRAVSMNCIMANRSSKKISSNPKKAMDTLIEYTLQKLTNS